MNPTVNPGSSLRPLSLPQKSSSLRSVSPITPSTGAPSSTSFVASPDESNSGIQTVDTSDKTPSSRPATPVSAPSAPLQRHQKRFSTLSYNNSPRSPHAPTAFQSPIIANFSQDGSEVRTGVVGQGVNGTLSRSSSRGSISGHRTSMERTGFNKRSSLQLESYEAHQEVLQQPSTPSQTKVPLEDPVTTRDVSEGQDSAISNSDANIVLTLAEKHADLLQFIAQKEAKCLELRTQLATHEAELKALKAKWTSIVQRANPSPSQGSNTPGGINLATVGRIFSNVTAPLASALDVLDPLYIVNSGETTFQPSSVMNSSSESPLPKLATNQSRGHTPTSSARSSASSFAPSRNSISSISSTSVASYTDATPASHGTYEKSTADTPSTSTNIKIAHRTSLLMPHLINANVGASNFTGSDESASTTPNDSKPKGVSSWLPGLDTLGMPSATTLNKKWEEIQKGETFSKGSRRASTLLTEVSTSFINTFAPPLDEPLRPSKPRLMYLNM
ncbi:hypothetical protein FRC20_011822 [Serendipita sp. 405]|nr:hypothetical protein FRC20_011822 [Serendipita sp. 405]